MNRLWRASHLANKLGTVTVPASTVDFGLLNCIHLPVQQLTSLRAFSAVTSPQPTLIRDFAIIGMCKMMQMLPVQSEKHQVMQKCWNQRLSRQSHIALHLIWG